MSYILDALKRADAERERGHIPGLHSRSAPTLDRPEPGRPRRWLPAGLIGLALLLAAGLGLWWWQGASRDAPVQLAPAEIAPAAPPAAVPPEPTPAAQQASPPALPILAPEPPRPPRPTETAADRPAEPVTPTVPAAATAPADVAPAAAAAVTANPVRSFAELAPDVRARLPAVNVSGSTYSQNPAHRMLIVNGKVVQEGGEISPGLKLETIEQRSAVLNHQGLRYRIGY